MNLFTNLEPALMASRTVAVIADYGADYLEEPEFRADFDKVWASAVVPPEFATRVLAAEQQNDIIGWYFRCRKEFEAL